MMRILRVWFKATSFFCLTLSVSILLSCSGGGADPNAKDPSKELEETKVIPVQVYRVQAGEAAETITATGTILPWHEVVIASETSGKITEVYVELGARIGKGDVIVQVDKELKQLALEQAEAQLVNAEAAYTKASRDLQRSERLFEDENVSEFELENVRLQEQIAKSTLLTAQAAVKMAKRQLRDARIESPIDGIVADRMVDLGGTVGLGTPMARIVDISQVKVRIGISEEQIVKVKKGMEAGVSVDAYPGTSFKGRVSAVGPEANGISRLFPVEIVVTNPPDSQLKSGMVARVTVASEVRKGVPQIPRDAILERAGDYIVFVVSSDKVQRRTVTLGIQTGNMVEILDGISVGEDVVMVGQESLSDGVRVQIQED